VEVYPIRRVIELESVEYVHAILVNENEAVGRSEDRDVQVVREDLEVVHFEVRVFHYHLCLTEFLVILQIDLEEIARVDKHKGILQSGDRSHRFNAPGPPLASSHLEGLLLLSG
jgi:hypothetical protein